MARIVDNGDGTFRYIEGDDPLPRGWKQGEGNPPPLPPVVPNASPVYNDKRVAAVQGFFTPEAAADLYNTPTHISYSTKSPYDNPLVVGQYNPQDNQISVWQNGGQPVDRALRHEFLHSRYVQDNPLITNLAWTFRNSQVATPEIQSLVRSSYDVSHAPYSIWNAMPVETYAYMGQDSPVPFMGMVSDTARLTPRQRSFYYPGVFDEPRIREWTDFATSVRGG